MHISKTDSHMDNHPVLLAIDKWWIILIRNGFNSTAKTNLGDFSQSGCLFWFFIFIFSIQWRLIVTAGHSIKLPPSRFIPPPIKIDTLRRHSGKCSLQSLGAELEGKIRTQTFFLSPGKHRPRHSRAARCCIESKSIQYPWAWCLLCAKHHIWGDSTERVRKGSDLPRLPSWSDLQPESPQQPLTVNWLCWEWSLVSFHVPEWSFSMEA